MIDTTIILYDPDFFPDFERLCSPFRTSQLGMDGPELHSLE